MSGRARPSRPHLSRSSRRALTLGLLLAATAPAWPARAADQAVGSRGTPTQDGWWNRLQGPVDGEPDGNPIRPFIPAAPQPATVPADAIATSAGAGQVDKVAAVGIDFALADGAAVGGLTLRLKESPVGGANVGAEGAKVTACPATIPWGSGRNAAWRERPTADCSLGSADGARAADGTWTFDLTAIARRWGEPLAPLAANGVVLSVDPAGSPSPVQVSWLDFDSGNVAVDVVATPPAPAPTTDGGSAAAAPIAAASPASSPDGAADTRAFPAQRGGLPSDPFVYPPVLPTAAAATPAGSHTPDAAVPSGSTAPGTMAAAPGRPDPVLRARPAVGFWEHVPAPTALLVPIVLGLAGLIGVVLGPMARPSPVFRRAGGLSRALARRSPGGNEAA